MIRPWVFEFFPELTAEESARTGRSPIQYFEEYLSLWASDESRGFEGIFYSEHHFGGSFSASPNLLIAAVAGRTKRLRLGVMGVVLPYYTAARVIEEIGMLDHLTGGRLEIGTAFGVPQELTLVGIDLAQARSVYDESVAILDQALESKDVTYDGKHFKYDKLRLLPRTVQLPHPPKWSTVVSPDSAKRAAQRNSKICTGFSSTAQVKAVFDAYCEAVAATGREANSQDLGLRRRVVVATSFAEASDLSNAVAERYKAYVAEDPRVKFSHVPDAPKKETGIAVSEDEFIFGTPGQVAEQIVEQCRHSGAGHFMSVLHWGAGLDEVRAAHDLFAADVIPVLRKAN